MLVLQIKLIFLIISMCSILNQTLKGNEYQTTGNIKILLYICDLFFKYNKDCIGSTFNAHKFFDITNKMKDQVLVFRLLKYLTSNSVTLFFSKRN